MAVNATSTREINIETLVRRSYQLAGLMNAAQGPDTPMWTDKASMAYDFLEVIVDALQGEGPFAWDTTFYDVDIAASTKTYTLPATTMDVVGSAQFVEDGGTGSTLVQMKTREEYSRITNKDSEGRPYIMYADRDSDFTLYLWPVPDAAGTLTIQRRRLLGDFNVGSKTVDLERVWVKYLWQDLAHHLKVASGRPPNECGYLRDLAEKSKRVAIGYSRQRPPTQMVISHRSGWRQ